jgi:hypothetical protein
MESMSRYEIRDQLRRILASKHFAKARKRNLFLEFVCEQALLGNGDKLNEHLIGIEVYERGPDFNPQEDAIVRVQASDIRKSLRDYYAADGRSDPWRIDLPPGHYVPVFTKGPPSQPDSPSTAPASGELPAQSPIGFLRRNALRAVAALAVVCMVTSGLLLWKNSRTRAAAPVSAGATLPAGAEWFWKPFLPPAEPPLVVLPNHPLLRPAHAGDSPATLRGGHLIPKAKLAEFRDTIHFHELQEFNFVSDSTDFTGIGEAIGLVGLFEFLSHAGQDLRPKPARLVDFDTLKRGNAIILGGTQGWSGRIFSYPDGFALHAGVIENKHPRAGEQSVYRPEFDPVTNSLRRDYALVLMLPNGNHAQRVLLAYGIYTKGTQAAMEYVTNPECLQDLRGRLVALMPDRKSLPRFFQVLLTTTVENDVPGRTSFVSARIIPQ